MAKALWQITDYLKEKGESVEFDKDSKTLFVDHSTEEAALQSRFYYDEEMEVLSCQCIYMDPMPTEKYAALCELANRFNSQLGFGSFVILEEEDLVFEINQLQDATTPLSSSNMDKLCAIPAEAMAEHLSSFLLIANKDFSAEDAFEAFWEEQ